MENVELWSLMRQTRRMIAERYDPIFDRFMAKTGLDSASMGMLIAALTFEPEAITSARLQVRNPYTARNTHRQRLADLAEKTFLAEAEPGDYRLTASGREEAERLIREAHDAMILADPLPSRKARLLGKLIFRLVHACLETPPPPEPWSIRLSYRLMPEAELRLPYIEQALSCLSGYRDDAHLTAWRPAGLSAQALECLTLLWRKETETLEGLYQKLATRGHSLAAYTESIEELRERGFIGGSLQALSATPEGVHYREQVEKDTDRYFFHPWSCLGSHDREELATGLTRLQAGLKAREVN
jgi:hypothetical protein